MSFWFGFVSLLLLSTFNYKTYFLALFLQWESGPKLKQSCTQCLSMFSWVWVVSFMVACPRDNMAPKLEHALRRAHTCTYTLSKTLVDLAKGRKYSKKEKGTNKRIQTNCLNESTSVLTNRVLIIQNLENTGPWENNAQTDQLLHWVSSPVSSVFFSMIAQVCICFESLASLIVLISWSNRPGPHTQ